MKLSAYFRLFALVSVLFFFASCEKEKFSGEGAVVTVDRNVTDFYKVKVEGNTDAFITYGTQFKVQVKGYENLVPKLKTVVENGTLVVGYEPGLNISNDNSEVYITLPALVSVVSQGNSDISISGSFIGMDVFTIEKNGLGEISVDGVTATNFRYTTHGNNEFKGFGLRCENAIISLTGNGTAEISVSKNLNATVDGNGKIYYKGTPEVKTNITGNGAVIKS